MRSPRSKAGERFARSRSGLRIVRVTGSDATAWLHDLVTADIASLEPGQARRSLLLTPTGRIRADFMVGRDADVDSGCSKRATSPARCTTCWRSTCSPRTSCSTDSSADSTVWSLIGGAAERAVGSACTPSLLGPGCDLVRPRDDDRSRRGPSARPSDDLVLVGPAALERWRVLRGDPRMGADFEEGALPSAVGLDATIDTDQGMLPRPGIGRQDPQPRSSSDRAAPSTGRRSRPRLHRRCSTPGETWDR